MAGDFSSLLTLAKPNPIFVPTYSVCESHKSHPAFSLRIALVGVAPAGIVSGAQFPGNIIPSCMINPNAAALVNAGIFPANNTVDGHGNAEFNGGANAATNLREEIVRIDHNFNSKFSVFGHYIAEQVSQGFAISQWSGDNVPTVGDTFGNPSYSARHPHHLYD